MLNKKVYGRRVSMTCVLPPVLWPLCPWQADALELTAPGGGGGGGGAVSVGNSYMLNLHKMMGIREVGPRGRRKQYRGLVVIVVVVVVVAVRW